MKNENNENNWTDTGLLMQSDGQQWWHYQACTSAYFMPLVGFVHENSRFSIIITNWNKNVIIWMKFSSPAALEIVCLATCSAVSDENFIKIKIFLFQWLCQKWCSIHQWNLYVIHSVFATKWQNFDIVFKITSYLIKSFDLNSRCMEVSSQRYNTVSLRPRTVCSKLRCSHWRRHSIV